MSKVDDLIGFVREALFGEDTPIDDITSAVGEMTIDEMNVKSMQKMTMDPLQNFITSPELNNLLQQFIMQKKYTLLTNMSCSPLNQNATDIVQDQEDLLECVQKHLSEQPSSRQENDVKTVSDLIDKLLKTYDKRKIAKAPDDESVTQTFEIVDSINAKENARLLEKEQWEGFINFICNYIIPKFLMDIVTPSSGPPPSPKFKIDVAQMYAMYMENTSLYYVCQNNSDIVDSAIDFIMEARSATSIDASDRSYVIDAKEVQTLCRAGLNDDIIQHVYETYIHKHKARILNDIHSSIENRKREVFFNTFFIKGIESYYKSTSDIRDLLEICVSEFTKGIKDQDNTIRIVGEIKRAFPSLSPMGNDNLIKSRPGSPDKLIDEYNNSINTLITHETVIKEALFTKHHQEEVPEQSDADERGTGLDFDTFVTHEMNFDTQHMFYRAGEKEKQLMKIAEEQSGGDRDEGPPAKRARRRKDRPDMEDRKRSIKQIESCRIITNPLSIFHIVDKCILNQFVDAIGGGADDVMVDEDAWDTVVELLGERTSSNNLLTCMYFILYKYATVQLDE